MKYTVGDVVVCVEKKCEKYGFKVGQHYKIDAIVVNAVRLGNKWWNTMVFPNDFKLLEETAMKYNIGDVVVCVDEEREELGFKVGHAYTIMVRDGGSVMLDNLGWWNTDDYPDDFKLVEETTMKTQFIDVEKYAQKNRITLERANEEIQNYLFGKEYCWANFGKTVSLANSAKIIVLHQDESNYNYLRFATKTCGFDEKRYDEELIPKVDISTSIRVIDKPEYVEFNGKQYDKKKLEEALAMIDSAA